MKKLYCNLFLFFSVVFVLFSAQDARADRAAAGEIAYKWVSDSTYLLTYSFYRDCSGATAHPTTINLCYSNGCNPDKGNVTLPLKTPLGSNGQVVQSGWCGTPNTVCSGGTMKGYRKWVYEGTVTLPSRCANWRFVVSISARNLGITNITAGASSVLHSETTLNNIDVTASSSPTFKLDLIQYMCAGNAQYYDYSGVDADGDVLTYNLIQPNTAADNQTTCTFPPAPSSIPFAGAPLGGTALADDPFATTNSFNLDPFTGIMTFTPEALLDQQAQLTLQITKRRGTKIISQVTRDIQFVISNTCTAYPLNFAFTSSSGVLFRPNDTAEVCPDYMHKICFSISSIDPTVTISNVTDNHTTFSQTASTSTLPSPYPGDGTNSVTNCFEWTPKEADGGLRFLVIKSEICRPGTPKVYRIDTIKINTIKKIGIRASDTFICLGESTNLCMDPKGTGPWSWCVINPGNPICIGNLGLSVLDDTCTSYTPSSTTYVMAVDSSIRNTCTRIENPSFSTNQKEIKIVVVNPRIDAGPDTVICAYNGTKLQMNGNLINPQAELTYKWVWSMKPGTGNASAWLNDTSVVNPVLTIPDIDIASIPDSFEFFLEVIPSPGERCVKSDKVVVYVLKGFYILTGDQPNTVTGVGYKGMQKGISDTSICLGQSVLLEGWGDPGYKDVSRHYTWVWTPAAGVSQPDTFYGGAITLTPSDTGIITFALTATKTGCRDSTKLVRIKVEEYPVVDIGPDRAICFGDTVNLFADITPDPDGFPRPVYTYQWWPGGALARPDTFFTYFTGYRSEKIYFSVATPAGCSALDSMYISVQPRSFLTAGNDTAICPGDQTKISVTGDPLLQSVTWKPGNANIDSVHSLTPIVSPAFTTDYVVIGVDSNRCIDSAIVKVTVHPNALIYLEDSVTIYPGDVYQIEPQGNSLYYTWFPPVGLDFTNIANPKASPVLNTMYKVKGMTDAGCIAEDSIFIFVAPDSYIDIPNAFVPGRGTENNVFKPVHLGNATLKSFSIYNRWGTKVFESTNINEGWDGTFGGKPQPLGVYVYLLEAVTANGLPVVKQGNVTLVR